PEAAVGIVDERQRRIREEAADQLILRVDDAAVAIFAVSRLFFCMPPPAALREQADDQPQLRKEDADAAGHVSSTHLEEGRLTEEHDAAGRKSRLRDAPPLKLARVEHGRIRQAPWRNLAHGRAVRDPHRHVRNALGIDLEAPDAAADNSVAEIIFDLAV